ncbi:MAG: hypothetical protein ACRD6I_06995 [Candidatus Acidiferrales bacterium]
MQLDDNLKKLLRELGQAINEGVSESARIQNTIGEIRAAGYDIVLRLDATIGLAARGSEPARITTQDRRFLESLNIRVDEEAFDEEHAAKLAVTPQDLKFLKSLKISIDESL